MSVDPLSKHELERIAERMCDGKRIYGPESARLAAERMRLRRHRVSPYRCVVCGAWHVGHVPSMHTVSRIAQLIRQRAYPPEPGDNAR